VRGDRAQTNTKDLWPEVHDERRALLQLLETLTPEQWDGPTLCSQWRTRDVVGHIVGGTEVKLPGAIFAIAASGFRMNRYIERDGRRRGAHPVDMLLADFRNALPRTTHPPGQSPLAMLEDIVIHQIDIRRPLGQPRAVPEHRMQLVASYLHPHGFYPGKKLSKGLRLQATDSDWSVGDGPELSGPIEALALMLSGRFVGLEELRGEGKAILSARVGAPT
jgi:uncharacterized protein (TIGR03083 family)